MHTGFKDAYRRSIKVDSTSQIVNTYMRDHIFAMKDLTIDIWNHIHQDCPTVDVGNQSTNRQTYLKLQRTIHIRRVSNLSDLEYTANLYDLILPTRAFFLTELKVKNSNVARLLNHQIRVYGALLIPVPKLSGEGFVWHHARCSGSAEFRVQRRNDWVCVRRHAALDRTEPGTLNGRMPGRLNALFKLKHKNGKVYRLAHVTLLQYMLEHVVQGVEGMVRVGLPISAERIVIRIVKIEGIVHLIPLKPEASWVITNTIDLETWNAIYD